MMNNLFVPDLDKGETRRDMAAADGKRLKKLIGALRHLFRNSFLEKLFLHVIEVVSDLFCPSQPLVLSFAD